MLKEQVNKSALAKRFLRISRVAAINLSLIFIVLAIFELYVRYCHPELAREYIGEIQFSNLYNHTARPHFEEIFQFQDFIEEFHFNSMGLAHSDEIVIPRPDDTYRVLVVGDSFIQGPDDINSVPAVIQEYLSYYKTSKGKRLEFVNCGQSSYSPVLHIARFKHQLHILKPDSVILVPDLTDVFDDNIRYEPYTVWDEHGYPARVLPGNCAEAYNENLARFGYYKTNLYSYKWIVSRLAVYAASPGQQSDRPIFAHAMHAPGHIPDDQVVMIRKSLNYLNQYIDTLQSQGIYVSVAVYPHQQQISGEFNRVYEQEIRRMCQNKGITFRSFFDQIAGEVSQNGQIYCTDDMHFNITGYRILGRLFADYIIGDSKRVIGVLLSANEKLLSFTESQK